MIQQQIVEYAKAQLGLGISEQVIKDALVQAGWSVSDVDESMQNVAQKKAAETVSNTSPAPISRQSTLPGSSPVKPLNLKDLFADVGKKGATVTMPADSSKANISKTAAVPVDVTSFKKAGAEKFSSQKSHGSSKIAFIVVAVVALASIGAAIFFFLNNKKLADQVSKLTTENAAASSAVSGLSAQVTDLTASKQQLDSQFSAAVKEVNQLGAELLFFVSPTSSTGTVSFSLSGVLTVDSKGQYSVTTSSGLKVFVKNSSDQKVDSALKPLVGTGVEISGTHTRLSKDVTISAVNGVSL